MREERNNIGVISNDRKQQEIERLESERERLNAELDKLLAEYARATGNYSLLRGTRRKKTRPNHWSYWHKE